MPFDSILTPAGPAKNTKSLFITPQIPKLHKETSSGNIEGKRREEISKFLTQNETKSVFLTPNSTQIDFHPDQPVENLDSRIPFGLIYNAKTMPSSKLKSIPSYSSNSNKGQHLANSEDKTGMDKEN